MGEKFESDLLRGSLDLMVLSVLAKEPQYGYSIQKSLNATSMGKVNLAAGTLYPLLHRMEAEKLIKCKRDNSTGRRRKWYSLTAKGKKQLKKQANQWQQYADCMLDMIGQFVNNPSRKPAG